MVLTSKFYCSLELTKEVHERKRLKQTQSVPRGTERGKGGVRTCAKKRMAPNQPEAGSARRRMRRTEERKKKKKSNRLGC